MGRIVLENLQYTRQALLDRMSGLFEPKVAVAD